MGAVGLPNGIGMAAVVIAAFLAPANTAEAQVGLASQESQVTLTARVPSGAGMPAVGSPRLLSVRGSVREVAVTVRLSSNRGYQLLVHGTARQQPLSGTFRRVWVQGLDGNFHELREGAAVTVAHHQRHAGELEREVRYRLEHSNTSSDSVTLPVRYEIAVKPVI